MKEIPIYIASVDDLKIQLASTTNAVFDSNKMQVLSLTLLEKADLDSPVFIGNPKAPTKNDDSNDNSIATTKFVKDNLKNITNIIDDTDIDNLDPSENYNNFGRVDDKLYFVRKDQEIPGFAHIMNSDKTIISGQSNLQNEINNDYGDSLLTISDAGTSTQSDYCESIDESWWRLNGQAKFTFNKIIPTKISFKISSFFTLSGDIITTNYSPCVITITNDKGTQLYIECIGYNKDDYIGDVLELQELILDEKSNYIILECTGDSKHRFNIFEMNLEFDSEEWIQLANKQDIINIQDNIDEIEDDISDIHDEISEIEDSIGNVQINTANILPPPTSKYENNLIKVNDVIYLQISSSGSDLVFSFEKITGTGSTEITENNWTTFSNNVTNGFKNIFNYNSLSKIYFNSASVKFGSSKAIGEFIIDVLPDSEYYNIPITSITIDVKTWNTSSPSDVIVNGIEHRFNPSDEILQFTYELEDSLNQISILTKKQQIDGVYSDYRIILYGIEVVFGENRKKWVPFNKIGLADVATSGSYEDLSDTPDLADVAITGSYTDLINKPTIPTVNNATLTIKLNNLSVGTFTANASSNKSINITVPTSISDLSDSDSLEKISNKTTVLTADSTDILYPSAKIVYEKITENTFALEQKQDLLESGVNIKTINHLPLLGEGDIEIQGGGSYSEGSGIDITDDVISVELSIISGAQSGSTAVQPTTLNNYYTKDAIDSLLNNKADVEDIPDVSLFITKTVNDLTNYYTKSLTYTKTEVNNLVDAIKQFEVVLAASLPTADETTTRKIYLIPSSTSTTGNTKDEYITIFENNEYKWEHIGTTTIDLSNYYTKSETESLLTTELSNYTTTSVLTTLLNAKLDTITDLSTIRSNASNGQTAYINLNGHTVEKNVPSNALFTDTIYDDTSVKNRLTTIENKESTWDAKSDFSGSYNDLTDKPTIITPVQSDWDEDDTTSLAYIANKPVIPEGSVLYLNLGLNIDGAISLKVVTDNLNLKANTSDIPDVSDMATLTWVNSQGYLTSYTETDPTVPSHVKNITLTDITTWSNKQDTISDLTTIRNGATLGATAVLPTAITDMATQTWVNNLGYLTEHLSLSNYYTKTNVDTLLSNKVDTTDLAEVATSGNYNDLLNKPTIPTVPTTLSSFTDDLGASPTHTHNLYATTSSVTTALSSKVDKDGSKVLSDNNYTDADQTKLSALPTNVELQSLLSLFITSSVSNLANYYLKSETYTRAEVEALIAAISQFSYESVAELPEATASTMNKIYLVPSTSATTGNIKDEYITILNGANYIWELIGSTSIDLSLYYTKTQTDSLLSGKLNTISNLSTIESNAANGLTAYTNLNGNSVNKTVPADAVFTDTVYDDTELSSRIGALEELPAASISSNQITNWTNKQDAINDLEDIREGAELGSTALLSYTETDPVFTASVAYNITSNDINSWNSKSTFSGNYNDLSNKPTIPTATSQLTNDSGFLTSHLSLANYYNKTETNNLLAEKVDSDDLATVATTGSYNNLSDKPTIPTVPTKVSAFTNDAGYITGYTETDPVFTASAAHGITTTNINTWNNKQNALTSLSGYTSSGNLVLVCLNGTMKWISYTQLFTGTSAPSQSQGTNGDVYLLTE